MKELKPGARIVSHAFDMGDWKPERELDVNGRKVYLWTVPLEGRATQSESGATDPPSGPVAARARSSELQSPEATGQRDGSAPKGGSSETEIGALVRILKEGTDSLRPEAARLLGDFRFRDVMNPLLDALTDSERLVRVEALESLKRAFESAITMHGEERSRREQLCAAVQEINITELDRLPIVLPMPYELLIQVGSCVPLYLNRRDDVLAKLSDEFEGDLVEPIRQDILMWDQVIRRLKESNSEEAKSFLTVADTLRAAAVNGQTLAEDAVHSLTDKIGARLPLRRR